MNFMHRRHQLPVQLRWNEMNIISSTPAAAAEQVDGIEILVNMAKTGKMRPVEC